MLKSTLGERLSQALRDHGLSPVDLARRARTTEATISNWLNDKVQPGHVKAAQLFDIADAAQVNARELLNGTADSTGILQVREDQAAYESQPVQLETWKIAFQLVAEALGEDMTLPPDKQAEVTLLAHELLVDGLPRA
ncbi:MAG: helix-turn-helix transcriptional regulator, partial [Pseudoxanthomonas sp.]